PTAWIGPVQTVLSESRGRGSSTGYHLEASRTQVAARQSCFWLSRLPLATVDPFLRDHGDASPRLYAQRASEHFLTGRAGAWQGLGGGGWLSGRRNCGNAARFSFVTLLLAGHCFSVFHPRPHVRFRRWFLSSLFPFENLSVRPGRGPAAESLQ